MPSIDIDRDAAHQAAQVELNGPIYPKQSMWDQINEWINEILFKLIQKSASVSGGWWFTISVLLIL
ncbi:MAG: hypothetical protein WCB92_27565, partial [Mycobacterium sp.]